MDRICDACGAPYEAIRANARFCSDRCRKRTARKPRPLTEMPSIPADAAPVEASHLSKIVTEELIAGGVLDTSPGQAALLLAQRMELGTTDTGSAVAAMSRELRSLMAEALGKTEVAADPMDELKARRESRRTS
jgi:signal transduction histidine kinase